MNLKMEKKTAQKMLTFELKFIVSKHQLRLFAKTIIREMSNFKRIPSYIQQNVHNYIKQMCTIHVRLKDHDVYF